MSGVVSQALDRRIAAFIERSLSEDPGEEAFQALAFEIFAYQFEYNSPYRMFCLQKRVTPDRISSWEKIPPVPASAFKSAVLACFPRERAVRVFETSGTTKKTTGRHFFDTLRLYQESSLPNFSRHVLPDGARLPMRMLLPHPSQAPASSLVYMCETVSGAYAENAEWFIQDGKLNVEALLGDFESAVGTSHPRILMGTSYAFLHLFDALHERRQSFRLPPGSRMMETGGYKGKSREMSRDELYRAAEECLGIPAAWIVNEYGMTELSSQVYDNTLRATVLTGRCDPRVKIPPPWVKVRVVDPINGEPCRDGVPGVIRAWDMANRGSVLAIQTDDIGVFEEGGIRIVGRVQGSDPRGCARAADEILSG